MNKKGFTLVELMGVIAVMAILIVVVATNGFGAFNKAKSGIDKLEEDNLLEAARVFLVDVDNNLLKSTDWTPNCDNKNDFSVVCDASGICSSISINTNGEISKNSCTDCGCVINVEYLENKLYFDDKNDKCEDTKELRLKLLGELQYTDYLVAKETTDIICPKDDDPNKSIDYKLISAAKDYLKGLSVADIEDYYSETKIEVRDLIDNGSFTADAGYTCDSDAELKLQVKGRFVTNDYIADKVNSTDVICEN